MEVILLQYASNLGDVGDIVKVKSGHARNYLLPYKKALRATAQNKKEFEIRRAQIEKDNKEKKKEAEKLSVKIEGKSLVLLRQAGEDGRLYGSVTARDIADSASAVASFEVKRNQVVQFNPIKALGVYPVKISLHAEVVVSVLVNVARSAGEAELAIKEYLSPSKKAADENSDDKEVSAEESHEEEGKHKKKKKKVAKVVDVLLEDEVDEKK